MFLQIPEKLNALAFSCDFPLYVVGGFVRDFLAGLNCGKPDIDICAPVTAEKFCAAAGRCGARITSVYRNTGTVKLKFGEEEYEFSCFRSDEYVRGTHTPVNIFFTDNISLDARRRDFKCNAVYYDIKERKLVDPLGGLSDIENKVISTVAEADKVFGEDGLRLMRLARQAARLGFRPDEECLNGARHNAKLICDVSAERIFAELNAILHADLKYGIEGAQYFGLKILDETGVLDYILPELALGRGMAQNPAFHKYDVLEHSLRSVKYAHKDIRLAALLHDAGKPVCMHANGNYHEHERESARVAGDICARLKVPKKTCAEVVKLSALHMYDMRCDARENKIRKFIVKNYGVFERLLLLKQADFSACRDDLSIAPCVEKWRNIYKKMREEGAPFTLKDLNVRGDELLAEGVPENSVGKVLEELLYECAIQPELNRRPRLLKRALTVQVNIE